MPENSEALPTFAVTLSYTEVRGLTVEETYLSPVGVYSLEEGDPKNDEFTSRIPPAVLARHEDFYGDPSPAQSLEEIKTVLAEFGYRLEGQQGPFTLTRDDQVLSANIGYLIDFAANASKTSFFLTLWLDTAQVWLLTPDRFELYYEGKPRVNPIFVGEDLLIASFQETEQGIFAVVKKGEEVLYTSPQTTYGPETCPIDFFRAWNDHWILQIDGQVIMDGQPLGMENGYLKAFNWHLIQGKPLYLFQKGDSYGVWFDGEELPLEYDAIAQSRCNAGAYLYPFYAGGVDGKVSFYGQKNGGWYFVQLGSFPG